MTDINYKQIIENITNKSNLLNDWEINFIDNVYNWHVFQEKPLSEKQQEILLEINRKYICRR